MQWLNYFFVVIVVAIAFTLIVNAVELKTRRTPYKIKAILFILLAITFSFISSLLVNKMVFNK